MVDKILDQMEKDVAEARQVYMRAANNQRKNFTVAHDAWKVYSRLLWAYHEEIRKHG